MSQSEVPIVAPWYLVLEAWHPVPHHGLDGLVWPLPADHPASRELRAAMEPLPRSPGGCSFEVCFDEAAATRYFEAARGAGVPAYLIAVGESNTPLGAISGYDAGRPEGGFSVAGQEICRTAETFRRFGHLANGDGLFPSREALSAFVADRERRQETEGLEYLDESLKVAISVLRRRP